MLNEFDITALFITFKLAGVSTLILLLLGTPLAWWLSQTRWKLKTILEAIIALPLVLPPTVLGFYLLITLGPNGPVGGMLESLGGASYSFHFYRTRSRLCNLLDAFCGSTSAECF